MLASDGLGVCSFNDAESFLKQIETLSVPLVILDIWMEKMTGLEVQSKLAKLSPRTRVIVMTGRKDPGAKETAHGIRSNRVLYQTFRRRRVSRCSPSRLVVTRKTVKSQKEIENPFARAIDRPVAFFIKPFNDEKFLAAVRDALAQAQELP